jgi:hypothetical protein
LLSSTAVYDRTFLRYRRGAQVRPRVGACITLRQIAEPIGRAPTIGRPWLWRLRDPAVQKPSEN